MELQSVRIENPEELNLILGHSHFIKTVEDLYEVLVGSSPHLRFGIAFCEASGARLVRREGNDAELVELATRNALAIGAGHTFIVFLREGFPVNVLNHWGMDVRTKEEVDDAYEKALKFKDKYKIRQVLKPVLQHGVYSFYMEDLDHNWWEVQHYPGFQNEDLFDFGDRCELFQVAPKRSPLAAAKRGIAGGGDIALADLAALDFISLEQLGTAPPLQHRGELPA